MTSRVQAEGRPPAAIESTREISAKVANATDELAKLTATIDELTKEIAEALAQKADRTTIRRLQSAKAGAESELVRARGRQTELPKAELADSLTSADNSGCCAGGFSTWFNNHKSTIFIVGIVAGSILAALAIAGIIALLFVPLSAFMASVITIGFIVAAALTSVTVIFLFIAALIALNDYNNRYEKFRHALD